MNLRRGLLLTYRFLLAFYPAAFRERFAGEMLEVAEEAEPGEWPLILGDTGLGIVRCWFEGTHSTPALTEPNSYLALGGLPMRRLGLLPGFILSIAILVGLCYFSDWTAYRECPGPTSASVRR
jgi:hypothetical protein